MNTQLVNFNNFIKFNQSSQIIISNIISVSIIVSFVIYQLYQKSRKLEQINQTFKDILEKTPTIIVLEIDFAQDLVRTSNPLLCKQSNDIKILTRSDSSFDYQMKFEEFCQLLQLEKSKVQVALESNLNPTVKGNNENKYRFNGKYSDNKFQGMIIDISQEESELKQLKHTIQYDALTGLPNRYRLNQKIEKFCNRSTTDMCAIYFFDLNRFKQINDTHGHEAGDIVLKELSSRLQNHADKSILPIRLSGDEFLIIKNGVDSIEQANEFISNYMYTVSKDSILISENTQLSVSLSYGGVVFPKSEPQLNQSTDKLIKCADEKMYEMKKSSQTLHNNVILFN